MATIRNRTPAQTERRAAVEATVLAAAADLLEDGESFARVSVEQIAARAGIGRTAFYFYFRDKQELLMRLTEEVAGLLWEEADRWWSGEGDGAAELPAALEGTSKLLLQHASALRAAADAATYDDGIAAFYAVLIERFVTATAERIEREQAAGRAQGVAALETARALVWMTERRLLQHARDASAAERRRTGEVIDALTGVWLRAIYGTLA